MIEKQPPGVVREVKKSWEEWHSLFEALRENDDNTQIECGRKAKELKRQYGKDGVVKMAIEVKIAKKTMNERLRVVEAFDEDALAEFSYLSYSHLRLCARQKNCLEWATIAHDNNWTVENLAEEIKKTKPKKPFNVEKAKKKVFDVGMEAAENGTHEEFEQVMSYFLEVEEVVLKIRGEEV